MRNLIIFAFLFLISSITFSQSFKLGIQLSPSVSSNRIDHSANADYLTRDGSSLKFRFGPIADFELTETYFFTTGILFTPKSIKIKYNDFTGIQHEEYKLQYLQIPLAIKMYTNEIMLDTKIYVSLGIMTEFKIAEKNAGLYSPAMVTKFSFFDTSLLAAAGVEYAIGTNTTIFGGFSYNRGLINAGNKYSNALVESNNFKIRNDLINLDLGVKF